MGRNGMGKTTLLKALIGILPFRSGSLSLEGHDLTATPSYERVARGLAYVPQGRMIFPNLYGGGKYPDRTGEHPVLEVPDEIYELFPALLELKSPGREATCPAGSSSNWPSPAPW